MNQCVHEGRVILSLLAIILPLDFSFRRFRCRPDYEKRLTATQTVGVADIPVGPHVGLIPNVRSRVHLAELQGHS